MLSRQSFRVADRILMQSNEHAFMCSRSVIGRQLTKVAPIVSCELDHMTKTRVIGNVSDTFMRISRQDLLPDPG